MEPTTIAIVVSIFTGPLAAILISRHLDKRREIREEKLQIFKDLIAYKDFIPPDKFFLESFNLIPIVFYKNRNITGLHSKLINHLFENRERFVIQNESTNVLDNKFYQVHEENLLNLLNEMAKSLGYTQLRQTDMKKSIISLHEADDRKKVNEFFEVIITSLKRTQKVDGLGERKEN